MVGSERARRGSARGADGSGERARAEWSSLPLRRPAPHQVLPTRTQGSPILFVTHPDDRDEELSRNGFPTVVEWRSFLEAWWATLGPRVVGSERLVSMCDRQAVLGPFLGTGTERSRRTKLGILVTQRTDLVEEVFASPGASEGRGGDERRGFHVRIERCRDRKYKISMYRLVRVVPAPAD